MAKPLFNKILIIGHGLIGSSLALDIKSKQLSKEVLGLFHKEENLQDCLKKGLVDRGSTSMEIAKEANLIIIATPISNYAKVAQDISPFLKKTTLITDVGSVKEEPIQTICTNIKYPENFIPAHPIAGSEKSGNASGKTDLFKGKNVIFTPVENSKAQKKIIALWEALGAKTEIVDADSHDQIYALVSHFPQLLAFCYRDFIESLPNEISDELADVESKNLEKFTRLCSSRKTIWQDVFAANSDNIEHLIEAYSNRLASMRDLIAADKLADLEKSILNARGILTKKASKEEKLKAEDRIIILAQILPILMTAALVGLIKNDAVLDYAGTGFTDFTEILKSFHKIDQTFFAENKDDIIRALEIFIS
jgi:prephenate dehydrogenase